MVFQRLEDLRVDSDLRQKDVAEYLHMHLEVYRRYEKGIREIPVWALVKLADLYKTSTDYILGLTDFPEPYSKKRK
ncbi:MAG: helix-turn-helix domain-containing protein [Oscillospiraceae bacterium]|nr:helix-turn-helix domain-containing protein [Oscillospiraceae bacterium]